MKWKLFHKHVFVWRLYEGPPRFECLRCHKKIIIPYELTQSSGAFTSANRKRSEELYKKYKDKLAKVLERKNDELERWYFRHGRTETEGDQ